MAFNIIKNVVNIPLQITDKVVKGVDEILFDDTHTKDGKITTNINKFFDPTRIFNFGDPDSGFNVIEEIQDFFKIRVIHTDKKTLFEDSQFPCDDTSIYGTSKPKKSYQWKRPSNITTAPRFLPPTPATFDAVPADLGDSWLLSSTASLTQVPQLFYQVVPQNQSFTKNYAGVFHFRFWQYSRWIDIVIDDRLPTDNGKLVYMKAIKDNIFWCALLEKAYAKLHGSYDALKGGTYKEAMVDFTGGITEIIDLKAAPTDWFARMKKSFDRSSLLTCLVLEGPKADQKTAEGLVSGHTYLITDVKEVTIKDAPIGLIRIRNPLADGTAWNGAWNIKSSEWTSMGDEKRQQLGITISGDEFWITSEDFVKHFKTLDLCNLNGGILGGDIRTRKQNKSWEVAYYEGQWVKNVTAGGCRNFIDTFASNPQYRVVLQADEGDKLNCSLIIGLMQKNKQQNRMMGLDVLNIGFVIYQLEQPNDAPRPLDKKFFEANKVFAKSDSFINTKEMVARFKLPPGTYCIVPSTYDPNQEGNFLLRVFSEKANFLQEFDGDITFTHTKGSKGAVKPSAEDKKIYALFEKLAGAEKSVNWQQLRTFLNKHMKSTTLYNGFSSEVCRSFVATIDKSKSGKFGINEFKILWTDIQQWTKVFLEFDNDNNGVLNGFEIREAYKSLGYSLDNPTLDMIMFRYGSAEVQGMEYDDFLLCSIKLKIMLGVFDEKTKGKPTATFNLEEWLDYALCS